MGQRSTAHEPAHAAPPDPGRYEQSAQAIAAGYLVAPELGQDFGHALMRGNGLEADLSMGCL